MILHVGVVLEMSSYIIRLSDDTRKQTNWDHLMLMPLFDKKEEGGRLFANGRIWRAKQCEKSTYVYWSPSELMYACEDWNVFRRDIGSCTKSCASCLHQSCFQVFLSYHNTYLYCYWISIVSIVKWFSSHNLFLYSIHFPHTGFAQLAYRSRIELLRDTNSIYNRLYIMSTTPYYIQFHSFSII